MKNLLIIILSLFIFSASAQTGDVRGKRVIADQQLILRGYRVDTIKNDTTGLAGRTKSLLTADAIYKLVNGRTLGGGSTDTTDKWVNYITRIGDSIYYNIGGNWYSIYASADVLASNGLVKDASGNIRLDTNGVNPLSNHVLIAGNQKYFEVRNTGYLELGLTNAGGYPAYFTMDYGLTRLRNYTTPGQPLWYNDIYSDATQIELSVIKNNKNTYFKVFEDSVQFRLAPGGTAKFKVDNLWQNAGTKSVRYNPITGYFSYTDTATGGGNTIYTGDGTMEGNRTIDADGNDFEVSNIGYGYFHTVGDSAYIDLDRGGGSGNPYASMAANGNNGKSEILVESGVNNHSAVTPTNPFERILIKGQQRYAYLNSGINSSHKAWMGITPRNAVMGADSVYIANSDTTKYLAIYPDKIKLKGATSTASTTSKEILMVDADNNVERIDASLIGGGTPSLTQYRIAVGDASNQLSDAAAITGDRALISDANGVPTHSAVTNTELGYLSGATSNLQTQISNKWDQSLNSVSGLSGIGTSNSRSLGVYTNNLKRFSVDSLGRVFVNVDPSAIHFSLPLMTVDNYTGGTTGKTARFNTGLSMSKGFTVATMGGGGEITMGWSGSFPYNQELNFSNSQTNTNIISSNHYLELKSALKYTSTTITSNTSLTSTSMSLIYVDATSGNVTVTLPAASTITPGVTWRIVRIDASGNTVTVAGAGSDTINGSGSKTITNQYDAAIVSGRSSTTWVGSLQAAW